MLQESKDEMCASCALEGQGRVYTAVVIKSNHLASDRLASNPLPTVCLCVCVTFA